MTLQKTFELLLKVFSSKEDVLEQIYQFHNLYYSLTSWVDGKNKLICCEIVKFH